MEARVRRGPRPRPIRDRHALRLRNQTGGSNDLQDPYPDRFRPRPPPLSGTRRCGCEHQPAGPRRAAHGTGDGLHSGRLRAFARGHDDRLCRSVGGLPGRFRLRPRQDGGRYPAVPALHGGREPRADPCQRRPSNRSRLFVLRCAAAPRSSSSRPKVPLQRCCSGSAKYRHKRISHHFATAASRKSFESDPERYEIQLKGACAFMARNGAPPGSGDPDRYYVHGGRIYIFASENCRDSFKVAPSRYLSD